jgi:hypothetical protein
MLAQHDVEHRRLGYAGGPSPRRSHLNAAFHIETLTRAAQTVKAKRASVLR